MDTTRITVDDEVLNYLVSSLVKLIGNKVDKIDGKGLSTNDYTNDDKTKLNGIENGANNYVLTIEKFNEMLQSGAVVLGPDQYGDTLPTENLVNGRLFFLKAEQE